jgi:uroporphyrinogen-III decarboxylase
MDLKQLKVDYGDRITLVGGLDLRILEAGTPEETRRFGAYLLETLGPTGYIYCSSNSITPNMKPENYRAMIGTLLEGKP